MGTVGTGFSRPHKLSCLILTFWSPPKQVKHALEVLMRQAELMCENVKVEDLQAIRAAENSNEYRV